MADESSAAAGESAILRRTPLQAVTRQAGARMVPFEGWELPLQFSGLRLEHRAVRTEVGMFDISHMGVLVLRGDDAKDALQGLVPSDLFRIGPGEACYTVLLNEEGGILDDLIVYDAGDEVLLVINAACTGSDTTWLRRQLEPRGVRVLDRKGEGVLLAVQGPRAEATLAPLLKGDLATLPRFGHRTMTLSGRPVFVARTGYTGEDGFELLLDAEGGLELWDRLQAAGVTPCGLGARDTLRLEAALPLYGSDMDAGTTPLEASLGWLVHLEMPADFIGRAALERQTAEGVRRRLVGLRLEGRAIARHGHPVLHEGEEVGRITSGTFSPTLEVPIALASVRAECGRPGTALAVEIRGRTEPAVVVRRPFYRRG